jgi:predicted ATPase
LTFCSVLGQAACPIAFWAGDLDAAARYGAMLLEHTERNPIRLWQIWAHCFNGLVIAKRADSSAGLEALRGGLEEAGEARFLPRFLLLLGEVAACLGAAGDIALGLEIVDDAITRCEARDEGWYIAELLRIRGELLLLRGGADGVANTEQNFRRALDLARRHGALSWELRAATSLARLWRDHGRSPAATGILQPVYDRFTEGFDTADLKAAKALLDALR